MKPKALAIFGLTAFALPVGYAVTHLNIPSRPEGCHTVILDEVDLALRRLDYIAMDWGYGEWTTKPDANGNFQVLGYAMNEDSIVYNHLECVFTEPEY